MNQISQTNSRQLQEKERFRTGNARSAAKAVERTWSEQELAEIQARFDQASPFAFDGILIHKKIKILDANQSLAAMFGYKLTDVLEMTILDLILPEARSVVLRNTLMKYEKPYEAVGLSKDGLMFPIEIVNSAIAYQDHTVRVMAMRAITEHKTAEKVLDVLQRSRQELEQKLNQSTTELRYANERLRLELDERSLMEAELRTRARQQAAVAELGQRGLADTNLPVLINEAVTVAAQILEADYTSVYELSPDRDQMLLLADVGWPTELVGHATIDVNTDSPAGYALLANEPVIVEDLRTEVRFKEARLLHSHHAVSGISIVIQGREQPFGILQVYTTRRRLFTEDDTHFLQAIANVLAMAIERKRAEEQIRASMQEKVALLREIHDRVKNNLQIISSLLNLQSEYNGDVQADENLQDIQNRVQSMALIHEKLYHSENLARIDFGEYIRDLLAHLFRSYLAIARDINLNIQADQILLTMDTAIPCGLILNELVSNSLKHAFPHEQGGEIGIRFSTNHDGRLTLAVADNGVGLPPEVDFRATETLGLQLINTLVEQLDGTIELQRERGTEFKIRFPAV